VDGIQSELQSVLEQRNLSMSTDGLKELPTLFADPDLLHKAFQQLILNAIKFTPDGGSIKVTGRAVQEDSQPAEIEIVVSDTGIGIDPEHHQLIFDKFYQAGELSFHSTGKTKFKGGGPGLGLAIARGIVKAHHGKIWVESPGCDEEKCPGSHFYVRLPIIAPKGKS
jgi:signal transduction histidine kinase